MSGVFRFAAICFGFIGTLICISALIGAANTDQTTNLVIAGVIIYVSVSLFFAFRRGDWAINRVESFVLLIILWSVLPLPVAISFMQTTDLTLVDAYFEATSALTTTGASSFQSLNEASIAFIVLRGLIQWIGGLLTLVGVVLIMAPAGLGGLSISQSHYNQGETDITRYRARQVIVNLAAAYIILSIFCFIALNATKVPVFDAFHLMTAAVATGGMVATDTPISELGSNFTPYVLSFFMIIAGTSVLWQRNLVARRSDLLKQHRETYFYLGVFVILGITFAATFFQRAGSSEVLAPIAALNEGFFTAASLVSTSGLEIRNGSFSVLPATFILIIVLVGGCSLSTAGGISFYRIGGMLSHSVKDFTKLVYPNSVYSSKFGSQRYNVAKIKAIWSYFFAVMVVVMTGAVFLSLRLDSFEAALIASVAAFSNIGGFYATGWSDTGQWTAFHQMDAETKVVLSVLMILGRLHILVLLTAFNRVYWLGSR
ncbi:MAG: potassium transporter TrkG [Hyphomicrobiales bacterium]